MAAGSADTALVAGVGQGAGFAVLRLLSALRIAVHVRGMIVPAGCLRLHGLDLPHPAKQHGCGSQPLKGKGHHHQAGEEQAKALEHVLDFTKRTSNQSEAIHIPVKWLSLNTSSSPAPDSDTELTWIKSAPGLPAQDGVNVFSTQEIKMKTTRLFPLALLIAALGAPAFAAQPNEHSGHHPAGSADAGTSKSKAARPSAEMRRMDSQTDAMKSMHEKMVAAKTPEERGALMGEHMKTMSAGMSMMKDMPNGMGDMKSAKSMAECHAMMEKKMAMMGAAFEMMSDRLPQPAK